MSSFHSCMQKIRAVQTELLKKGKRVCLLQLVHFGKKAVDVSFKVSTQSRENKKELVKRANFNRYCRQRGRNYIKRWLEADDSDVYFLKESDTFFVIC